MRFEGTLIANDNGLALQPANDGQAPVPLVQLLADNGLLDRPVVVDVAQGKRAKWFLIQMAGEPQQ